jgi:hypothetical protein
MHVQAGWWCVVAPDEPLGAAGFPATIAVRQKKALPPQREHRRIASVVSSISCMVPPTLSSTRSRVVRRAKNRCRGVSNAA